MRLRIATFNLESLDEDGDPPLADRIAVLRPRLLGLSADILCLQEVNAQHPRGGGPRRLTALERLLEETPYAEFARAVSDRGGKGPSDRHNLVVLSRWPIVARREVRHDLVPPPLLRFPGEVSAPVEVSWDRPVLLADIGLPDGRPLHVVNLHLRAPLAAPIAGEKLDADAWRSVGGWAKGFAIAAIKRLGQALEIRLLVEQLFDQEADALIAVCGDFNADSHEMPLRTVIADVEETGNPTLRSRSLVPLERGLPLARRYSVIYRGRGAMVDHLLVSRALLARFRHVELHNEVLDEAVAGEAADRATGSDHAPLVAEFGPPGGRR